MAFFLIQQRERTFRSSGGAQSLWKDLTYQSPRVELELPLVNLLASLYVFIVLTFYLKNKCAYLERAV